METKDYFLFEPESHTYWLGERRLPSVSEIIEPLDCYRNVPADALQRAQAFGTALHSTIESWLNYNQLLDEALVKPLEGFIKWFESALDFGNQKLIVEKPTYHPKLFYGGTPDLVFEEAIIDIKSRPYNKILDPIQLAAYAKLYPDFPPKKLYVLEIDQDGKTTLTNAEDKQAWGMFRKLLNFYNVKTETEELTKKWKGK